MKNLGLHSHVAQVSRPGRGSAQVGRSHCGSGAPLLALCACLLTANVAAAQESAPEATPEAAPETDTAETTDDTADDRTRLGPIHVGFEASELRRIGGSVQVIGAEELEHHGQDDPESVILQVPGAQVRTEDGYGLRPNIGLRGVSSERSSKITLMEDGILFGPAPYAAPAAYFFPLMTRMVGVEVVKGPGTVLYGPHTVGGSLNLLSRQVPEFTSGSLELAAGTDRYRRVRGWVGSSNEWGGLLLEGALVGANGFKDLDFDPDANTGFDRGEALLTLRLTPPSSGSARHELTLRGGIAIERSNETYLGISDADFAVNPDRRYVASSEDRMEWERWEVRLRHRVEWDSGLVLESALYRHDFHRSWRKANRFGDAAFADVLADPDSGINAVFYDVLTGAADSASPAETVMLGTNTRDYVSQGVQTVLSYDFAGPRVDHELEVGVRLHNDHIERDHTEEGMQVLDQALVSDGLDAVQTADNRGEAVAVAAHASYAMAVGELTVNPGVRVEHVRVSFDNRLALEESASSDTALLPGLGLHYQAAPNWGLLAGVHRGFSPVAPGQPSDVKPEYSLAYEAGVRYGRVEEPTYAEVTGFFNDYSNMTSECAFSRGCSDAQVGDQFNAGEVNVLGVELLVRHSVLLPNGWTLPMSANYTLSKSNFRSAFESDDPQLGDVEIGDELPYLPVHQGRVEAGLDAGIWQVSVAGTFVGETREIAGTGDDDGPRTDLQALVDVFVSTNPWRGLKVSLRAQNIGNSRAVASRRPYGARPVRPFQLIGAVGYDF